MLNRFNRNWREYRVTDSEMASVVDRIAGDVERSDGEVLIPFDEFNSTFTANILLRSMVVSAGKSVMVLTKSP